MEDSIFVQRRRGDEPWGHLGNSGTIPQIERRYLAIAKDREARLRREACVAPAPRATLLDELMEFRRDMLVPPSRRPGHYAELWKAEEELRTPWPAKGYHESKVPLDGMKHHSMRYLDEIDPGPYWERKRRLLEEDDWEREYEERGEEPWIPWEGESG